MRSTSVEEKQAVLDERTALGGERIVEYSIFLTDAFGDPSGGSLSFLAGEGVPKQIDGFTNDDSYRQSRYLARKIPGGEDNENLRENSLARQLSEKGDRPAIIRLIRRRSKQEIDALNPMEPQVPWENIIPPNTKFFLENVQESRAEKVQVMDTFGEWIAFFFGRKPEVYAFSGTLLNARNHDWKNEFQENYDHFLRGTEAVRRRATMMIQYDDVVVEGYMLNCDIGISAASDKGTPFSFNLLVINRSPINPRNMIALRTERSGQSFAEGWLFEDLQEMLDLTREGKIEDVQTFILMREYFAGQYVPPTGTATTQEKTNEIDVGESKAPGVKGGITEVAPANSSFSPVMSGSIAQSGVTLRQSRADR